MTAMTAVPLFQCQNCIKSFSSFAAADKHEKSLGHFCRREKCHRCRGSGFVYKHSQYCLNKDCEGSPCPVKEKCEC